MMSDTPELSNVARVLISRMESHPEDFKHGERFGHLEDSLYSLIGIHIGNLHGGHGRLAFLSDADRAALAEAWRALNYKKFEKDIMDALFQSDAEREEEKKKYAYPIGQSTLLASRVAQQNSMLAASTGTYQPGMAVGLANNTAGTTLGGSGGFLSGLFGK